MNAAGRTLTYYELFLAWLDTTGALIRVDADGIVLNVDRVETDASGATLYVDIDLDLQAHIDALVDIDLDLQARIDALTEFVQSVINSNDKGSRMTKAEIIAEATKLV